MIKNAEIVSFSRVKRILLHCSASAGWYRLAPGIL